MVSCSFARISSSKRGPRSLAPGGRFVVDDNTLQMRTADELLAELNAGLTTDASDFNPLRLLGERK